MDLRFFTERPLEDFENWQRIQNGMEKLDYLTSTSTPVITSVEKDSKPITILQQVIITRNNSNFRW